MTEAENTRLRLYNEIVSRAPFLKDSLAMYALHLEAQFLQKYEPIKSELYSTSKILQERHDALVRSREQLGLANDRIKQLEFECKELIQQVMNAWEILVDIDHPKIDQVFTALGFNPDGSICRPLNV